ncbi:DUF6221 family protein [Streptomyces sp. NPDC058872]|uniref:DUF6221 family protein n=1 Tax=Streptomyces sp. NPDC058872 TaxID=3346661 RepID=UPI0036A6F6EA
MDDLTTFLRARLDDDERRARRGYYSDTHWDLFTPSAHLRAWKAWREHFPREEWDVKANDVIADASRDAIRERITAHEEERSTRMLAEVDAKRRILRAHDKWCAGECEAKYPEGGFDAAHYWAIKSLAAVYADHPDYRAEWRP